LGAHSPIQERHSVPGQHCGAWQLHDAPAFIRMENNEKEVTPMSVISGQRVVSVRKRVLAYCAQWGIEVPTQFLALDPVYALVVVDVTSPDKPHLVGDTFYNAKTVVAYLADHRRNPAHHRVLDFRRGVELLIDGAMQAKVGPRFDHRRDVDVLR